MVFTNSKQGDGYHYQYSGPHIAEGTKEVNSPDIHAVYILAGESGEVYVGNNIFTEKEYGGQVILA